MGVGDLVKSVYWVILGEMMLTIELNAPVTG
jgi:hypothetical protein